MCSASSLRQDPGIVVVQVGERATSEFCVAMLVIVGHKETMYKAKRGACDLKGGGGRFLFKGRGGWMGFEERGRDLMDRTGPYQSSSIIWYHTSVHFVSHCREKPNMCVLCDTMVREGRPCRALSSEQNVPCFSMAVETRVDEGGGEVESLHKK